MAALIPFNRKGSSVARTDTGFEDFYNMLDDFLMIVGFRVAA